ncbi:MAG: hypothetical protein L3K16_01140 [Thermoplasmata archaeon]|nr:hypothetical protein [Thermoplasmata archaeon]
MSEPETRAPAAWLAVPVFAYLFAFALISLRQVSGWAVLGAALTALPLVTCLPARGSLLPWAAPAGALAAGFLTAAPANFATGSVGMAIFGGVALASPVAFAAAIVRTRRDAALTLPLTFLGLVDLLTMRAALSAIAGAGTVPTPGAFAVAMGATTSSQVGAIGSLLLGSRSASLPLQTVTDPTFALLMLLSIVGAFLALFLPEPVKGAASGRDAVSVLVPVFVAVDAVAVFELVAARAPTYALLGLAVATLATVVAIRVVALARPWTRLPWRRRPANSPRDRAAHPAAVPSSNTGR